MMTWEIRSPLLLDGATGTNLMAAGMPQGVCAEAWILEHPEVLTALQREYVAAGSKVIYAPTFGANRAALKHYGMEHQVAELNRRLVELSRAAAEGKAIVAGDLSSTALQIEPFGDTPFDELIDIYSEQADALKAAGITLTVCETLMSLADARAALLAVRRAGMAAFVTLTVDANGRTLSGGRLLPCLLTLQAMGAAAVGINCSVGAEAVAELLAPVLPHIEIPVIAKPNAGETVNGELHNTMSPQAFADCLAELTQSGVSIVGGCCGTTPAHIRAVAEKVSGTAVKPVGKARPMPCSEREVWEMDLTDFSRSEPIVCDDELEDRLMDAEGDVACVIVPDVEAAQRLTLAAHACMLPLMIRAENAEALSAALRGYQGIALVDSNVPISPELIKAAAAPYGAIVC